MYFFCILIFLLNSIQHIKYFLFNIIFKNIKLKNNLIIFLFEKKLTAKYQNINIFIELKYKNLELFYYEKNIQFSNFTR